MRYRRVRVIDGKGAGPAGFRFSLRAIAVDPRNHLYACGDLNLRVFNPDGECVHGWATAKPGHAVAVAGDGQVYVGQDGQVQIFDRTGRLADTWRDAERLGRVTAIGFSNGSVFFGDARRRCIRRYDADGKFLNNIGKDNRTEGFLIPNGVLKFGLDAGGTIHAANPGKHRVERYTPLGELLGHIGRFDGLDPAGFPGCCNPTNLAVTGGDRIYVTEKAEPRVKVYDFNGALISVIADGVFDPNCKNMDISVDSRGRVYVVDTVKLEIHVFAPETQTDERPAAHA